MITNHFIVLFIIMPSISNYWVDLKQAGVSAKFYSFYMNSIIIDTFTYFAPTLLISLGVIFYHPF